MSDKPDKDAKPHNGKAKGKGKGMPVKLVAGIGLVGIGGGGVLAAVQAGMLGGGDSHEKEDNSPKLVRKGEEDPYAPKEKAKEGEGGGEEVHGDGGSEFKTSYYSFEGEFTSNLRDSDALIQMALACSTRRDGRVLMWLKKHELAIRSAMLAVLADTPEADIHSIEGKERLQKRLTAAINKVLIDAEGFGGIDAVYFKSFIIQ